jgi:hypothetical protein
MTWERFFRRRPSRRPTLWRSRRVGYRVRGLGKARPLTPDDGHEGSTLDGKRAHALRLGNDTGDTQTPPAVGDVAPIDGQVHELAAPADDAPTEPLDPLPKPKPRAAATLAGGVGSGVSDRGVELLMRSAGGRSPVERW